MVCDECNYYFLSWAVFSLLPPNSFSKNDKDTWRYHHFTLHMYGYLDMVRDGRMDRQTDRRIKKGTYGGDCST